MQLFYIATLILRIFQRQKHR